MEALKPLLVLGLFGTILYGAYSVVQKGPGTGEPVAAAVAGDAPAFAQPDVQLPAPTATLPALPAPVAAVAPAAIAAPVPVAVAGPSPAAPVTVPSEPAQPDQPPTYLTAESAAPPVAEPVAATTPDASVRPDRLASLPVPQLPATMPDALPAPAAAAIVPPASAAPAPSSAAFASAWADAHDKLAAGRYAEALAGLSVWYDDPSLGLEESQRLEDLLGQLAGTVIYSQDDLLLPPHVVAAGDTLQTIAAPLGVSWQLLAKINGVGDPNQLIPGERLKLVRGPFDAVVSVSRRRVSMQLHGTYAGSFPVVVGRQYLDRVGGSIPVATINRADPNALPGGPAAARTSITLADGLVIEAVDDPAAMADAAPSSSLVVSSRDLAELIDILGPGSRILIRQ
ncbi:MAG: LysM peptidoglycan-binding domain-containing protein [Pirellulales bacterium]